MVTIESASGQHFYCLISIPCTLHKLSVELQMHFQNLPNPSYLVSLTGSRVALKSTCDTNCFNNYSYFIDHYNNHYNNRDNNDQLLIEVEMSSDEY